jgi:hypothetical protein
MDNWIFLQSTSALGVRCALPGCICHTTYQYTLHLHRPRRGAANQPKKLPIPKAKDVHSAYVKRPIPIEPSVHATACQFLLIAPLSSYTLLLPAQAMSIQCAQYKILPDFLSENFTDSCCLLLQFPSRIY